MRDDPLGGGDEWRADPFQGSSPIASARAIKRLAESADIPKDELLDGFTQAMEAWEKAGIP